MKTPLLIALMILASPAMADSEISTRISSSVKISLTIAPRYDAYSDGTTETNMSMTLFRVRSINNNLLIIEPI